LAIGSPFLRKIFAESQTCCDRRSELVSFANFARVGSIVGRALDN
jgi:hypothetical protein